MKISMSLSLLLVLFACIDFARSATIPSEHFMVEAPAAKTPFTSDHKFLAKFLARILEALNIQEVIDGIKDGKVTTATCYSCKFGFSVLQHLIEFGVEGEKLVKLVDSVCKSLHIETPEVCDGVVKTYKDEFLKVFSKLVLSPSEICGIILGSSCGHVKNPFYNWQVQMTLIRKPPVAPKVPVKNVTKTLKVLHISDTHIDNSYVAGSNAECSEPLCCRKDTSVSPEKRSGYWGDYRNCDIPLRTFDQMLKHISLYHKDIDYVIWTGDIPPHDIWNQTREGQLSLINEVSALIHKHLGYVPVFPALGNHESTPVNSFPPSFIKGNDSIDWLYSDLQKIWLQWLPNSTISTINKGAYYSVKVKPGLKLISMNMNYCNNQNWWLLLNTSDPTGELEWLVNELQASELLNESVHIIGHIPPGVNDCLQVWSKNYYQIINRYENTVVAQFFGHTHHDEFEIFYDESNVTYHSIVPRATNLVYITPSVTTFNYVNPAYRIYTVDDTEQSPHLVLDHVTYFVNLTEANQNPKKPLYWKPSYSALKGLGLQSMEPQEWHDLVIRMITDDKLFQKFYKYYYNRSDYIKNKPCDENCKQDILCGLVTGKSHDSHYCDNLFKLSTKNQYFYSVVNETHVKH
ncbi:Sphingomyelin phosphodiesterase-like protein [Leptotrombidium deliense]|uniref:Sphingomyelin phosphodiesterase n=1 Tax=Leptotrombidium deliense TaxID=299467 RepID=A0A443SRF2_9ACAR|nr:Sphingomyelin phosphodiesterase-like protein [Leptotrombidium deliense]